MYIEQVPSQMDKVFDISDTTDKGKRKQQIMWTKGIYGQGAKRYPKLIPLIDLQDQQLILTWCSMDTLVYTPLPSWSTLLNQCIISWLLTDFWLHVSRMAIETECQPSIVCRSIKVIDWLLPTDASSYTWSKQPLWQECGYFLEQHIAVGWIITSTVMTHACFFMYS